MSWVPLDMPWTCLNWVECHLNEWGSMSSTSLRLPLSRSYGLIFCSPFVRSYFVFTCGLIFVSFGVLILIIILIIVIIITLQHCNKLLPGRSTITRFCNMWQDCILNAANSVCKSSDPCQTESISSMRHPRCRWQLSPLTFTESRYTLTVSSELVASLPYCSGLPNFTQWA